MKRRKRRRPKESTPPRLTIELVPGTTWFSNLRSILPREDWDALRRPVYRLAGYRCEICGGRGDRYPVAAHEVWEYDDRKHIQRLIRLIALCPACHEVKHIGLAGVRGRRREATAHLREVNQWSERKAEAYIRRAFQRWHRRTDHEWTIEVDWDVLAGRYGVTLSRTGLERVKSSARKPITEPKS